MKIEKTKVFDYLDKLRFEFVARNERIELVCSEFDVSPDYAGDLLNEYLEQVNTRKQLLNE